MQNFHHYMKKLIISLGNPIKSDDNIGNLVLDKLKQQTEKQNKDNNTVFIRAETTPENFFYKAAQLQPNIIYIIDAVDFSGSFGEVKLFDFKDITTLPITTTHNTPITMLSGFVNKSIIKLIAIQPKSLDVGEELSEELKEKFENIYEKIKQIIT